MAKIRKNLKVKKNKLTSKLPDKLINYLKKVGIKHNILEHKTVYTAFDVANTLGRKLDEIAKSLFVLADKDYYLVIIPADYNLDFNKLKAFIKKQKGKEIKIIKIPGEKVMAAVLKIKPGAMSAFGSLYSLPVLIDNKLAKVKKAIFSSGSFNHSVEIAVKDFIKLENAILGNFGIKKKVKLQSVKK